MANPTEVRPEPQAGPFDLTEQAMVFVDVGIAVDLGVRDDVQGIGVIIQGVGEHWYPAKVESHDPRAYEIDRKRINTGNDEPLCSRIASHRAVAVTGDDAVHHAEI